MKKSLKIFSFILTAVMLMSTCVCPVFAAQNALYVSVNGSDAAAGTKDAPLATMNGVIEKIKKDGLSGVTAYFGEGFYTFNETLDIEGLTSGLTVKAENGADVVFSTASPVTGFTETTVNGVRCFVKEYAGAVPFTSLHSADHDVLVTRYPENGYLSVTGVDASYDLFTKDNAPWELTLGQRCIQCNAAALPKEIRNEKNVLVRILHYWHDEMLFAESIDRATGKIVLAKPCSMLTAKNDRFFLENVFSALNAPGEYYIDNTENRVYYVPCGNETADTLTLYGASESKLISMKNCAGIAFEGIRFSHTAFSQITKFHPSSWLGNYGMDFPQACIDVDCAFSAENCENIACKNCEFTDIGCSAVGIGPGCGGCRVENCYFENIGANAIFIDGLNCLPGQAGYTHDITVTNNEIYRYGRRYFCAIGVLLTHCDTAVITHNEIHDGYYTAISDGWVWGYGYSVTKNITIEYNLIYDIGQGWLSDMGGIYTLGKQPGTTLRYNVIHNVAADTNEGGYGGWGIYFDEGSSEILAEYNLMFCCGSQGFHTHYGDSNKVRNCISALNGEGAARPGARYMGYNATDYEGCIFVADGNTPIYCYMGDGSTFSERNNLFWNASQEDFVVFAKGTNSDCLTYKQALRKGYLEGDAIADPMFTDIRNYDFSFASDEGIALIGFDPWDYSVAGTVAGSTIGIGRAGGETPYAQGAKAIELVKTDLGFAAVMAKIFHQLFEPMRYYINIISRALGFGTVC